LRIKVTIYSQKPLPGRADEFRLTQLETLDLGNHPVQTAPPTEPVQSVELVGRQVPVYPGADGVEVYDQIDGRCWGNLSYVVPGLPYPSRDVAAFYSEWALDHEWLPVKPPTRSWQGFFDATHGDRVWVCQLLLEWREKKSGDRLVVICEYRVAKGIILGEYRSDSARDQIVHVGIYPAGPIGGQ